MVQIVNYSTEAHDQLMQDSLEDWYDISLEIFGWDGNHISGGFPISNKLAQAIHDKLLSSIQWRKVLIGGAVLYDKQLQIPIDFVAKMVGCYPEDDEALCILQSAFRQVEMKKLVCSGMFLSIQQHQRMLQAVFAKPIMETDDDSQTRIATDHSTGSNLSHSVASSNAFLLEHLEFDDSLLLLDDIPMINQWLHGHPNIRSVAINQWKPFDGISASQFLAQAFMGVPHHVEEVELILSGARGKL